MIKSLAMLGALSFTSIPNAALAQQGEQLPLAMGPRMTLALEAAQTAFSTYTTKGDKVIAAIVACIANLASRWDWSELLFAQGFDHGLNGGSRNEDRAPIFASIAALAQ